jgi:hypothetical protein
MRTTTRLLAPVLILVLAVGAVAVPATALAQSAGDEQYVDPFQEDQGTDGPNSPDGSDGGGNGEANTTPDDDFAQAPADAGDTAGTTAAQTDGDGSLPNTGLMIGGVALAGVLLLGGGMTLRRLWRPRS